MWEKCQNPPSYVDEEADSVKHAKENCTKTRKVHREGRKKGEIKEDGTKGPMHHMGLG